MESLWHLEIFSKSKRNSKPSSKTLWEWDKNQLEFEMFVKILDFHIKISMVNWFLAMYLSFLLRNMPIDAALENYNNFLQNVFRVRGVIPRGRLCIVLVTGNFFEKNRFIISREKVIVFGFFLYLSQNMFLKFEENLIRNSLFLLWSSDLVMVVRVRLHACDRLLWVLASDALSF